MDGDEEEEEDRAVMKKKKKGEKSKMTENNKTQNLCELEKNNKFFTKKTQHKVF